MVIRWDKFTLKAQEAIQKAGEFASEYGNPELLPLHVLIALAEDREGIVPPVLEKIGANPQAVAAEARRELERLPKVSGGGATEPQLSAALSKIVSAPVCRRALRQASPIAALPTSTT